MFLRGGSDRGDWPFAGPNSRERNIYKAPFLGRWHNSFPLLSSGTRNTEHTYGRPRYRCLGRICNRWRIISSLIESAFCYLSCFLLKTLFSEAGGCGFLRVIIAGRTSPDAIYKVVGAKCRLYHEYPSRNMTQQTTNQTSQTHPIFPPTCIY